MTVLLRYDQDAKRIEATEFARPVSTRMRIPMDLLQQKSHIFFYDSVILAQDKSPEGESEVSVKIRVMENFFLILLRCYLVTPHGVLMRDVRTTIVLRPCLFRDLGRHADYMLQALG